MMDVLPDIGKNPDYGLGEEAEFKVRTADFGDGYIQRQPNGLNSVKRTWNLTWGDLTEDEKEVLYSFLISRKGAYAFLWHKPLTTEVVQVVCPRAPKYTYSDYDQYSLSVTLEEDFTP